MYIQYTLDDKRKGGEERGEGMMAINQCVVVPMSWNNLLSLGRSGRKRTQSICQFVSLWRKGGDLRAKSSCCCAFELSSKSGGKAGNLVSSSCDNACVKKTRCE